ncbi:MAG: MFS transporter [Candidatus Pacebacteria bacterium]|jgi:multidrug resistance protein|nr:MFS transporter [Candidatus Paceibacterota bacterium]
MKLLLRKDYLTLFLIKVTEVLGFSLILPFMPFYAKELGASPLQISLILATFSFFQFFMSPIMGRLSDVYGRKPLLIFSQVMTALSFLIFALANSVWMLVLSRLVDGLFGSNFVIAQAYLTDISSKKDRSVAMGMSGMAFGFGFLIGPALGGFLAQRFSYALPAYLATALSVLTILMTIFLLKETVKSQSSKKVRFKFSLEMFELKGFAKYFKMEKLRDLFLILFFFLSTQVILTSNMAIYGDKKFAINAQEMGLVLTGIGLITIIMQGGLLKTLIKKFGEKKLLYFSYFSLFIAFFALSLIKQKELIYFPLMLAAVGWGLFRPIMMGNISRKASDKEQGAVLGVASSLGSISQMIGPVAGGFILSNFYYEYLIYFEIILLFVIGIFISRLNVVKKSLSKKKNNN